MGNSNVHEKLKDAPLVVVIGAGFAGLTVAQKLESEFNVLVLEARDALYFSIGAMRATCDREFASKILLPYTNAMKYGKIAKARVTRVTSDAVYVDGYAEPIPFDYLVIATGGQYSVKAMRTVDDKLDSLLDEIKKTQDEIEEATNIAIVGGGAVGCEWSGEILRSYPKKKVTLITRGKLPLASKHYKDELGEEFVKRTGPGYARGDMDFTILTEHSINPDEQEAGSGCITTDKGKKVGADLVLYCTGTSNGADKSVFAELEDAVDAESGQLKVDDTLRIPNHSNIFAIGDATLYDEPKTAIVAQNGGEHVIKAINALHRGKELPKYAPVGDSMFVPWGEYTGVAALFGFYLTGGLGYIGEKMCGMKGGDLLTGQYWKQLHGDMSNPEYKMADLNSEEVQAVIKNCLQRRDKSRL